MLTNIYQMPKRFGINTLRPVTNLIELKGLERKVQKADKRHGGGRRRTALCICFSEPALLLAEFVQAVCRYLSGRMFYAARLFLPRPRFIVNGLCLSDPALLLV